VLAPYPSCVTIELNSQPAQPIVDRGFSESAWKSLAVKSLRIGWPEGLNQAVSRLGVATVSPLLLCGIFEDIFPAMAEIGMTLDEVSSLDLEALCARETHHGRGYTEAFCDLEHQAIEAARTKPAELYAAGQRFELSLPRRSLNCFYTWMNLQPNDTGVMRRLDGAPWRGMPKVVLDGHTLEGKRLGQRVALLSGHYQQHRVIGQRVMREGWGPIRAEAHEDIVSPGSAIQRSL
jgi:hypothetical protein